MALHTSTLILYKNSAIEIDRNFMVDSLADYLATLSKETISSFQYIKHGLAINIKIDKTQATLDYISDNNYNYCSIQNDDGRLVYYYIVGKQWRGQSTIELNLQMDTINTFALGTDYTLSKQSVVNREHKDRYEITSFPEEQVIKNYFKYPNVSPYTDTIYIDDIAHIPSDLSLVSVEFLEDNEMLTSSTNITITDWRYSGTNIAIDIQVQFRPADIDKLLDVNLAFNISYENSLVRKIDKFAEGISPVLYKSDIAPLYDLDNEENWYLIYKNANAVVSNPSDTQAKLVNPITILLCKDSRMQRVAGALQKVRIYCKDIPNISGERENVCICYDYLTSEQLDLGDTIITINGVDYTLCPKASSNLAQHKVWGIMWTRINPTDLVGTIRFYDNQDSLISSIANVSYLEFYNIMNAPIRAGTHYTSSPFWSTPWYWHKTYAWLEINSGNSDVVSEVNCIKDVDLTDSQLVRIIALPYCPIPDFDGKEEFSFLPEYLIWNSGAKMIELSTTNIFKFDYVKDFSEYAPTKIIDQRPLLTPAQPKDIKYESKLYMSEFYYQKFVYGSYGFQFSLEYYDITNHSIWNFDIEYAVSQSVQSRMLFKFNSYITDGYDTQDYNDVLLVGMNNEKAIYNNAFVNYIRSGQYTNDVKNMNTSKAMSWLSVGLSGIGTIASFALAPFTGNLTLLSGIGMATSTFGQIAKTITSTNQNERNLEQRKQALAHQGESVSAVEDIDLLNVYSNNKPKMVEYHPSEAMKKALYDLFFYCGYATREYKIPSFSGRKYFNFVMADIKYSSDTNLPEDIKEDIKNKYAIGITCLHKVSGAWDFEQQYENYETSLE